MRKIIIILLAALGAGQVSYAQRSAAIDLLRSKEPTDYVWVAAHRADCVYAPENSLEALEHALFFGSDIIETDARITKDGHIVIMHDYTVDRMTDGTGTISEMTLDEIKKLRLNTNWGGKTSLEVPTLEEFIKVAKGKACLYLDKASYDLPGNEPGTFVKELLQVLRENDVLEEAIFVLDWPYEKAKRIFGDDLEKVIYCPVIDDKIPDLEKYVDEYLNKLKPIAFQFRMDTLDSVTYRLLPKILASGSRAFIAATWDHHTAGHSDNASIFKRPSEGWGWLVAQGFNILETNYQNDLIRFLDSEKRRNPARRL